jgi:hypothetical protein
VDLSLPETGKSGEEGAKEPSKPHETSEGQRSSRDWDRQPVTPAPLPAATNEDDLGFYYVDGERVPRRPGR